MLFASYEFIGFLIILFFLYYMIPTKYQWILLLIFSYIFYAVADVRYLPYILASTVIVYVATLRMQRIADMEKAYIENHKEQLTKGEKKELKKKRKSAQKKWLIACIVLSFAILACVKYIKGFFSDVSFLVAPMGISFYTLQIVGYAIDVYRGSVRAEKNFFKVALFVSFFPQLVQGPISRFGDLSKTLYAPHTFDGKQFCFGIERILWGFFKKMVVADCVLAGVTTIIGDLGTYDGAYVFVVIFLYTLQLYADFTGGIDVTIGVAQALGIVVAENFNCPFFSRSLKEYWRRWHITMCEWFRTYVFFSISSSKMLRNVTKSCRKMFGDYVGGRIPVYMASFVTWFATGLWHGASWNFVVWGLANWVLLMAAEEMEPACAKLHARRHWNEKAGYKVFQMLRTFLLVCCLNLFDCYASVSETVRAFASIFTKNNWGIFTDGSLLNIGISASGYVVLVVGVVIMFLVSLVHEKGSVREKILQMPYAGRACLWGALFLCILVFGTYGIGYDSSQFIYNRF